jgi:hypothetical protein
MTNEELVEELLIEASAYGLRQEVIDTATKIIQQNPRMDKYEAYEQAYYEWIK